LRLFGFTERPFDHLRTSSADACGSGDSSLELKNELNFAERFQFTLKKLRAFDSVREPFFVFGCPRWLCFEFNDAV
jgi:hypothetical protein